MTTGNADAATKGGEFPPALQAQLADFWSVYEDHFDAIQSSTSRKAEAHPQFGPILRAIPPEVLADQQAASRERLRRAVAGDWEPYLENLREQGTAYARMGLDFAAWYDIVGGFSADLVPLLVEAYAADPRRLSGAVVAMGALLDLAMSVIAGQYLETKEELIRQTAARHTLILKSSLDAVISMDDHGVITEFNPAAERMFGHAPHQVIGRALAETIIPERYRAAHEAGLAHFRATGEGPVLGRRVELQALRADGTEFPVELAIVPLRVAEGRTQFTGFIRDLTEVKEAERANRLFAHVFETAHFGIVISDADSRTVSSANRTYARMLGWAPEEMTGRAGMEFVAPEAHGDLPRIVRAIEERGHDFYEVTLLRRDGSTFPAMVSTSALPARPGEPRLRISTVVDITERKQLERARAASAEMEERNRRAEEASRLKSEFLANMSHELRTPLNSIIGFAELLHDGEVGPVAPRQREFLGDILSSGRHLLQLINDVLDLSKVEAGKLEFYPESIEPVRVVAEVVSVLRTLAASKGIRVQTEVSPEVGTVHLDPARLKQVLYNYLSNAIKFSPAGGQVAVRVLPAPGDSIRLEVEDNGIGIAPTDIGRLFHEFQQLDASASKEHGGTGLGLALTRRLVVAQGGEVGVESRLGRGSTFHAVLPRRGTGKARVAATRASPASDTGAPSILVVEDDPRDQALIVEVLAAAGYRVDAVSTGAEAVAMCREIEYAALTLDLLLPDMNGLDVLRTIRADAKNAGLPVVVITIVREAATGAFAVHDVLVKPLDAGALLRSLNTAGLRADERPAVLVVDDDSGALKIAAAVVEQLGFEPVAFTDGREALASLDHRPAAAVLLDLVMADFDGFEFLAQLRASPRHAGMPVLVWTGKDLSSHELAMLQERAAAVVAKGSAVGLAAAIRACLGARGVSADGH